MKYRIFWSIFCVSLAVLLLSCGAMIYLAQNTVKDNSLKSLTSFVKSLATSINTEGINIVKSNIKFPYRVTLIKQDGSVYFDNEADPLQMGNHLERKEIKEAIKQGYGSDVRISNTLSERTDY